jgi:autophagy-related protein 27
MHRPDLLAFLLPLLAAPAFAAETLDCGKIRADGHTFDLSKLGGPHSVVTTRFKPSPPEHYNTTYTLDICKPLKKKGGKKDEECPNGTRGMHKIYQCQSSLANKYSLRYYTLSQVWREGHG